MTDYKFFSVPNKDVFTRMKGKNKMLTYPRKT